MAAPRPLQVSAEPVVPSGRYAVVDVHYPRAGGARAAVVIASDPTFGTIVEERTADLDEVEPYRPGAFFDRELPALRAVLQRVDPFDLLVVDGYVDLDPDGRPGLGAHVHAEVGVPVIGVAKSAFRGAAHAVPVLRGASGKPLHVTAAGMTVAEAAALVRGMAGDHRIPDALRRVDALGRGRGSAVQGVEMPDG
jgi:deoxyribonuclease V